MLRSLIFCVFIFINTVAIAAVHEVLMLNNSNRGIMAFEPSVLEVNVGDQVKFIPKEVGAHNTVSSLVPKEAEQWASNPDTEIIINITQPGIYFYICQPHLPMGMVGFIVANKDLNNLEAIIIQANKTSESFALNQERLQEDLETIKNIK